jgi:hypothetical protein
MGSIILQNCSLWLFVLLISPYAKFYWHECLMSVRYVLNCTFRIGLRVSDRVVLLDECRTESHRTKSHCQKVTDERSQDKTSQFKFCILTHVNKAVHYVQVLNSQCQEDITRISLCTGTTTVAPGYALYIYNKDNSGTRVCVVQAFPIKYFAQA